MTRVHQSACVMCDVCSVMVDWNVYDSSLCAVVVWQGR